MFESWFFELQAPQTDCKYKTFLNDEQKSTELKTD